MYSRPIGHNTVMMRDVYLSYTAGGDMEQLPASANADVGMSRYIGIQTKVVVAMWRCVTK